MKTTTISLTIIIENSTNYMEENCQRIVHVRHNSF